MPYANCWEGVLQTQLHPAQQAMPSCLCGAGGTVRATPGTWHPDGRIWEMMGGTNPSSSHGDPQGHAALVETHFLVASLTSEQTRYVRPDLGLVVPALCPSRAWHQPAQGLVDTNRTNTVGNAN